jgi:hypothetical protein
MADEKDKVVQFEDYKDMVIPDDEDTKKKREKERMRRERKAQNDRVLRLYQLGKYKNK